jgi:hypothetical protein
VPLFEAVEGLACCLQALGKQGEVDKLRSWADRLDPEPRP